MEVVEGMTIATDADDIGLLIAVDHKKEHMDHEVHSEGFLHAICVTCGDLMIEGSNN